MIKRILLPVDFSEHSQRCVDYLKSMSECNIGEIIVLNVADSRIIANTDMIMEDAVSEQIILDNCHKLAEKKNKGIVEELEAAGFKTRTEFQVGVPFVQINKAAEEFDVSLVVMGHRGHNMAEELLLGSTAEKVARKCKRAVLLVR